ncbi:Programmed cell death 4a, partial [Operophtera brumata]
MELEEYLEDANDPNYDSEAITNGDVEFKQVIVEAEPDEIVHGDTSAANEDFMEFLTPKRSHLHSSAYLRICIYLSMSPAFERLLEKLPDLVLDTPDAATLLSNFIARCVADDCLPPKLSIHRAETLLSMKQGLVRLDNIWGVGGGIRPVKSLIRQIQLLLKEYLTSGELAEAMRCVRDLEVPHFHHELVYETVLLALETVNSSVEEQLCTFLTELRRCVIVTPDQMDRDMSDIVLDVPLAYIMLDRFMERCQHKFRLGDAVLKRMPT